MDKVINKVIKEQSEKSIEALNKVKEELKLTDITTNEKKSLLKLGGKSIEFSKDAMNTVSNDDSFMYKSFDINEMKSIFDSYNNITNIIDVIEELHKSLIDTQSLLANSLYETSLEIYKNAKNNNKKGEYDVIVEKLAKYFEKKKKEDAKDVKDDKKDQKAPVK